jgi:hypothetical protein
MIVNNLYVVSIPFRPPKTDAVLIIDPDAVLTFAVFRKGLQMIAGRHFQV